jgi:hypothetical protein
MVISPTGTGYVNAAKEGKAAEAADGQALGGPGSSSSKAASRS